MKKKILLDKVTSDKRLVVTYDQYNWIVKFGSAWPAPQKLYQVLS